MLFYLILFAHILLLSLNAKSIESDSVTEQTKKQTAEACPLVISLIPVTSSICEGDSVTLSGIVTGGIPPFLFDTIWSPDGFSQSLIPSPVQHSVGVPNFYSVTVEDPNLGCSSVSNTVDVNNAINVVLTPSSQTICVNQQAEIIGTVTGKGPAYDATLSDGITTASGGSPLTFTVNPSITTSYAVATIISGSCLVVDPSNSVIVNVAQGFSIALSSNPSTICAGNTSHVSVTVTGGTGPYNVQLSDGQSKTGVTSPIVFEVSPTTTTTYTVLSITDTTTNCMLTNPPASTTVTVGNTIGVALTPASQNICLGNQAHLKASVTGGTPPFAATLSDGSTATGNSPLIFTVTPDVTTTYTFINLVDSAGCTAAHSNDATVNVVNLSATLTANPAQIAAGQSSTLIIDVEGSTGPVNVLWSDNVKQNNVIPPVIRDVRPTKTENFSAKITDATGCTSETPTVTVQVTAPQNAIKLRTNKKVITLGQSAILTVSSIAGSSGIKATPDSAKVTLSWSDKHIDPNVTLPFNRAVKPAHTITYTVAAQNTNSRIKSNPVTIGVQTTTPSLSVELNAKCLCENSCTTLRGTIKGGTKPFEVEWSTGRTKTTNSRHIHKKVCPCRKKSFNAHVRDASGNKATSNTVRIKNCKLR